MSKFSKIAVWVVLIVSLLSAKLWADGISNGGGSSGSTISTGCGATGTTSSVLFSKNGVCSGDTGFTYAGSSGAVNMAGNLGVTGNLTANLFQVPGGGITLASTGGVFTGVTLSTTASVTHANLVTGTNADFLCLSGNNQILIQTTACTISSLRFKPDWKPYSADALKKVSGMEVGMFHTEIPNADPNWQTQQAGLNAENIAKIAPECAVYENDMKTPKSYRQECVIALLVRSIQELRGR